MTTRPFEPIRGPHHWAVLLAAAVASLSVLSATLALFGRVDGPARAVAGSHGQARSAPDCPAADAPCPIDAIRPASTERDAVLRDPSSNM
jgi:hypothetical protein